MPDIEGKIAGLRQLDTSALCRLWKELLGNMPPPRPRRNLMVPILAYKMQVQVFGSLRPEACRRLRQLARKFELDPKARLPGMPVMKPGTRLVRKWQDQIHVVSVLDGGYEYRDVRYKTLSRIARLITGTRWSGPLFFGVKRGNPEKLLGGA